MITSLKITIISVLIIWILTIFFSFSKKNRMATWGCFLGSLILLAGIFLFWLEVERPPMRTLGETRLWYAFFLPLFGLILYRKLKDQWIISYSCAMAILFLSLNLFNPDHFDKTLMPALQSIWFIPHVIVYIIAYALLGISSLTSFWALFHIWTKKELSLQQLIHKADPFVHMGFVFLTFGLLFGALWAKEAWGHYWTWDPKETWAFITWIGYLNYLHFRARKRNQPQKAFVFLAVNFIIIMLCWFGVNYMPSAATSIHTYSS